jgi:hypothetical protein
MFAYVLLLFSRLDIKYKILRIPPARGKPPVLVILDIMTVYNV